MANFPFLPKDDAAAQESAKIMVKKQPRNFTIEDMMDEIITEVAPKFPNHSRDEIREAIRTTNNVIIDTLLSGKDIRMDDGSIWSLDADGRTIIIYPAQNKQ